MSDTPVTSPPPTCACLEVHGFPCQFDGEPATYHFDGKDWCMFHLPAGDKSDIFNKDKNSGKGSYQYGWEAGSGLRETFSNEVNRRITLAKSNGWADLRGVVFPTGFTFSAIPEPGSLDCQFATFGCPVSFSISQFGNYVNFNKAIFEHTVNFSGKNFGEKAVFSGVRFMCGADFTGAKFQNDVNFSHAVFEDAANFSYATFGDNANFAYAKFNKTNVGETIILSTNPEVDFNGSADFNKVTFGKKVNFSHAVFEACPRFMGAILGEEADFSDARFKDGITALGAKFGNRAKFSDAKFLVLALFGSADFGHGADFKRARFVKEALFVGATFGELASFDNAFFGYITDFSFNEAGHSIILERPDQVLRKVIFSEARFMGITKFTNREFDDGATFETSGSFNHAEFHDLVEFHGCTFHQGMSFHQTKFLKTKEDKFDTKKKNNEATEALERSYRTLKLGMENLRARNEEAMFFALEMESRRKRSDVPRIERLAATLYKHLSDYGQAVDLPLLCLLALANISFLVFGVVALATDVPDSVHLVGFTFEQMFRPFYVWSMSPVGTAPELVKCNPLLIPLLASVQSLATVGLLTLFLLALRRRFKMD